MSDELIELNNTPVSLYMSGEEIYALHGVPYLSHHERTFNEHQKKLDMINKTTIPERHDSVWDNQQFESNDDIDKYKSIIQQLESETKYIKNEQKKYKLFFYVLLFLFLKYFFIG